MTLTLEDAPTLKKMECSSNKLSWINISKFPCLREVDYSRNNGWDIGLDDFMFDLRVLKCEENYLTDIDLSLAPNLEELNCFPTTITELDVRPLLNLKKLSYGSYEEADSSREVEAGYPGYTRLLQRPDQHFK